MFEAGAQLKQQYGADQVFDFSLGNPILEPPTKVHEALHALLDDPDTATCPMEASRSTGVPGQRAGEQGLPFEKEDLVLCVGAGGGLNVVAKPCSNPEMRSLPGALLRGVRLLCTESRGSVDRGQDSTGGFSTRSGCAGSSDDSKTPAIIVNSPNNPTGVSIPRKYSTNSAPGYAPRSSALVVQFT